VFKGPHKRLDLGNLVNYYLNLLDWLAYALDLLTGVRQISFARLTLVELASLKALELALLELLEFLELTELVELAAARLVV